MVVSTHLSFLTSLTAAWAVLAALAPARNVLGAPSVSASGASHPPSVPVPRIPKDPETSPGELSPRDSPAEYLLTRGVHANMDTDNIQFLPDRRDPGIIRVDRVDHDRDGKPPRPGIIGSGVDRGRELVFGHGGHGGHGPTRGHEHTQHYRYYELLGIGNDFEDHTEHGAEGVHPPELHSAPVPASNSDEIHDPLHHHRSGDIIINTKWRRQQQDHEVAVAGNVSSCIRTKAHLHTQRRWSITYKGDSVWNPKKCGHSVQKALKWKVRCKPVTDWTCVRSGREGEDQVTIEFHTAKLCRDKAVHEAVLKGTKGKVDVWCKHQ